MSRGQRQAVHSAAKNWLALLALAASAWTAGAAEPAGVAGLDGQRLAQAAAEPQNWLSYYGSQAAWSYSPLDQVNRGNVARLAPAWAFATGSTSGLTSAPVVVDGVMYLHAPRNRVFALDATNGQLKWTYEHKLGNTDNIFEGVRGLAVAYGQVYIGTLDNHVVALDAATGLPRWSVQSVDPRQCGCNITAAPLLVKDMVVVGSSGGDNKNRGYIHAFDARTGKLRWRFWTIPAPGEPGSETWAGDSWRFGGAAAWYTGSFDPQLNLIYWGVGNPSSDYYGGHRKGDNLYAASLVALDADTGQLRWHYQEVPHDLYDYGAIFEPVLIDLVDEAGGARIPAVVHPNKSGYTYVLDRRDGRLLNAWSHAESINWSGGLDPRGRPVKPLVPSTEHPTLVCPSNFGSRSVNHSAYSPRTGLWYNTSFEICGLVTVRPEVPAKEGAWWFSGSTELVRAEGHAPFIGAFDPRTGQRKWARPTDSINLSSLLATGGDLLFGGDVYGNAWALDAETGEQLWSFPTGGAITSSPITFSVNGRQYVALGSGAGVEASYLVPKLWPEKAHQVPRGASTLFVFALDGNTHR
ncbi:pyrroloquinoline quinone-dependent dehydrogenase [Roseateles flavus]|uniref:PQQ-binding-like beta-propeller repeat protein n=1 Tax=Roseateles flavus TaxID=3149041 RepID=A0ABV0GIZ1_9BURK